MFLGAPTSALAWAWWACREPVTVPPASITMLRHPQLSGFMAKHSGLP